MPLFLRRVDPHREAYRVILKDEDGETELGSIAPQRATGGSTRGVWRIDTVIPMREARPDRLWRRSQGLHEAVSGGLGQVCL